jgi:5-methyltetrahydrofolate--homocysteine methyltransferase
MQPILSRLKSRPALVADGAVGTLLMEEGLQAGASPESLNLTNPQVLRDIARVYLEAGAEIVQTNTFGGTSLKLAEHGLDDRCDEINERAVDMVNDAVGGEAYVSGSCGPTGRILQPYGDASPDIIYESFVRQLGALIRAGVDVVCVETMIDLNEAVLAIKAAKETASHIPVMATMTFDDTPRGFYTVMGTSIQEAAAGLLGAGADIVGANCGSGIETMVRIAQVFQGVTTAPIMIQSNAGNPQIVDGNLTYPEGPDFFAQHVPELIDKGISIIGGCCGTTPAHTRAFRQVVDAESAG